MFRLLADECIHADMVLALRQNGFEIQTVKEAGLAGADDEAVFSYAVANDLIIFTFDRGFGDIFRFSISKSPGIIIILVNQMLLTEAAQVMIGFMSHVVKQMSVDVLDMGLKGKLAIIGKNKIRIIGRWNI